MLFANDPHASVFSADDHRKLAGAYEGLLEYERLYKARNTTGMQNQKRTNYEMYRIGTAKDSLGKYRSVIFEYIGLIALSEGRVEEAKQHLTKAKEFSGGVFYTETARNFPLS